MIMIENSEKDEGKSVSPVEWEQDARIGCSSWNKITNKKSKINNTRVLTFKLSIFVNLETFYF